MCIYSKSIICKLELQRSLSNTEDECTHLKEMNERTQEELRELANKYVEKRKRSSILVSQDAN